MAANDLAALADVKSYLSITDNLSDALLAALITSMSQMIQTFCEDPFLQQTYDWVCSGWGSESMPIPYGPVQAITSVYIDGVAVPAQPAPGRMGYVYDPDDQALKLVGYRFTRGAMNVEINYTGGYASQAALPMDLQFAVWRLVALQFRQKDHIDVTSENAKGVTTVSYLRAWAPDDVVRLLDHYTRRAVS